jgi:hypothetical protein
MQIDVVSRRGTEQRHQLYLSDLATARDAVGENRGESPQWNWSRIV